MARGTQLVINSLYLVHDSGGQMNLSFSASGANPNQQFDYNGMMYNSGMVQWSLTKVSITSGTNVENVIEARVSSQGPNSLAFTEFDYNCGITKIGENSTLGSFYQPEYTTDDYGATHSTDYNTEVQTFTNIGGEPGTIYDSYIFGISDGSGNYDFALIYVNRIWTYDFNPLYYNLIVYDSNDTLSTTKKGIYDALNGVRSFYITGFEAGYPETYTLYRSTSALSSPTPSNIASLATAVPNALSGSSDGMGFPNTMYDTTITDPDVRYWYYYINTMGSYDDETGTMSSSVELICSAERIINRIAQPTDIVCTPGTNNISVSFEDTGYNIVSPGVYSGHVDIRYSTINPPTGEGALSSDGTMFMNTLNITGLTANTTYYIQLRTESNYSTDYNGDFLEDSRWTDAQAITTLPDPIQLSAPTGTVTTALNSAAITFSPLENVIFYKIRYGTSSNLSGEGSTYTSGDSINGLTSSTTYYFQLKSIGDRTNYSDSDWSEPVLGKTLTPDTTAPIVTLNGDSSVTILKNADWTDPGATATDNVDGSITPTVSYSQLGVSKESFDSSIIGVWTITYSATDSSGNTGTATRTVTVSLPKLTAPTITGATTALDNITLTFSNVTDATGYRIRYSSSDPPTGEGTLSSSGTEFVGLSENTMYYFQVKAVGNGTTCSDSDWSASSNYATWRTLQPPTATTSATADTITLTITQVDIVTTYKYRYGTTNPPTGDGTDFNYVSSTGETIEFTNLTSATTYYFQLKTISSETGTVSSDWGNVITKATNTPPDTVSPVVTLSGEASITLNAGESWSDPGATATDNVDGSITPTVSYSLGGVSQQSFDSSLSGVWTITYTATDDAGNSGTGSRTVTVIDQPLYISTSYLKAVASAPSGAYLIKISAKDSTGNSCERPFVITIGNPEGDHPPTNILLSSTCAAYSESEQTIGAISVVDEDLPDDTHTFELTSATQLSADPNTPVVINYTGDLAGDPIEIQPFQFPRIKAKVWDSNLSLIFSRADLPETIVDSGFGTGAITYSVLRYEANRIGTSSSWTAVDGFTNIDIPDTALSFGTLRDGANLTFVPGIENSHFPFETSGLYAVRIAINTERPIIFNVKVKVL